MTLSSELVLKILQYSGLLTGCNKKQKLCDIFGVDYAIRVGYYAINYANCVIFSSAILSILY